MIDASRELVSPRQDVRALLGEPFHRPGWRPCYQGAQPGQFGLGESARWAVRRRAAPRRLRRPAVVVVTDLASDDRQERLDAGVRIESVGPERRGTTVLGAGSWRRLVPEGAPALTRAGPVRRGELRRTADSLRESAV